MKIFPLKRPEEKLISILEKIKEYLLVSDDSDWSSKTPNEIIIELDESIQNLREKGVCETMLLKVLFAPTGDIQETALISEWHAKYIKLSSEFDKIITKIENF
jgi:hypothetical protein